MPDGERGQIVIPPATERGCVSLTIRKPSTSRFTLDSYAESGRLSGFEVYQQQNDLQPFEKFWEGSYLKGIKYEPEKKLEIINGGSNG